MPSTRLEYWKPKFARTIERDRQTTELLMQAGWQCQFVWECELAALDQVIKTIVAFLQNP
jgi:DNA mismatch endonuclease (patch repair protein)